MENPENLKVWGIFGFWRLWWFYDAQNAFWGSLEFNWKNLFSFFFVFITFWTFFCTGFEFFIKVCSNFPNLAWFYWNFMTEKKKRKKNEIASTGSRTRMIYHKIYILTIELSTLIFNWKPKNTFIKWKKSNRKRIQIVSGCIMYLQVSHKATALVKCLQQMPTVIIIWYSLSGPLD